MGALFGPEASAGCRPRGGRVAASVLAPVAPARPRKSTEEIATQVSGASVASEFWQTIPRSQAHV
eukprot:2222521-Lingulodinium_polyedra.AAC.1